MKRTLLQIAAVGLMAATPFLARQAEPESRVLSPSAIVADREGRHLFIACETGDAVLVFDTESETVLARHAVPDVRELALAPDERRLYAVAGEFNGVLHEINLPDGRILRSLPVGHTPVAPRFGADGQTLFFANRFARADQQNVHALDLKSGRVTRSARALREPVTMDLSRDGATLWVVNHLPLMPAHLEHVYTSLHVLDSVTLESLATLNLPPGSFAIRDSTMSANGAYFYVTHTVGRFNVPTTHLDRGWINTSAVSIFDVAARAYLNTVLLDDTMLGAANPWGIATTPDDAWLCVNIAGTHELMVIDTREMARRLQAAPNPQEVIHDLAFLRGAKTRVPLEGNGPRALVVHGDRVYSAMRFSGNLNVVEIWEDGPGAAVPLTLGEVSLPDLVRRGEIAFNDATLSFQRWQSCASCHPDARADAVNWDLLNDGVGNPKQSRSLLYTHRTSPVMITGVRASAEIAVERGFSAIHFHSVPVETLDAVNAFLKSLEPTPSPYLNPDQSLSFAALRGKAIFEGKAGCAVCHTPPYFGDKKKYAFGLGTDADHDREFATPILIEAWRTAPYMYDGRAVSMREVVTTDNHNNRHGNTRDLTPQEVADLVIYINSL